MVRVEIAAPGWNVRDAGRWSGVDGPEDECSLMRHHTDHARDRALERCGITVTDAEWTKAVADIMEVVAGLGSKAMMLHRFQDGHERWLVRLGTWPARVIYDPVSAVIVTVLPD